MPGPLEITFQTLINSKNSFTQEVLSLALQSTSPMIVEQAVIACVKRYSPKGHVDVIRKLPVLPDHLIAFVCEHYQHLRSAWTQALTHGDDTLQQIALQGVAKFQLYDQVPHLVAMLQHLGSNLDIAIETLELLAYHIYDQVQHLSNEPVPPHITVSEQKGAKEERTRERPVYKKDPVRLSWQDLQKLAIRGFDESLVLFEKLKKQDNFLQALLVTVDPHDPLVRKVFWQSSAVCRDAAIQLLLTSRHPGVMQHITSILWEQYPHPKIFDVLTQREDPEFINFLLQALPEKYPQHVTKNLQQIEQVRWINRELLILQTLPASLQAALVRFVMTVRIPQELKQHLQEWLLSNGTPQARMIITDAMHGVNDDLVQHVVLDSLDSDNPEVQAWATSQLRSQRIPEALSILVQRLDSPFDEVREVAREELHDFDLERIIPWIDKLEDDLAHRAGQLILKINPDCIQVLQRQLHHPIYKQKIRAIDAIKKLGWEQLVLEDLLHLTEDEDAVVRAKTIPLLAKLKSPAVLETLEYMVKDKNPNVRSQAAIALSNFGNITLMPETLVGMELE